MIIGMDARIANIHHSVFVVEDAGLLTCSDKECTPQFESMMALEHPYHFLFLQNLTSCCLCMGLQTKGETMFSKIIEERNDPYVRTST